MSDWASQGVEEARVLLQELCERIYWEQILDGAAVSNDLDPEMLTWAEMARRRTDLWVQHLEEVIPHVEYEVVEENIVVVLEWGIRCEPTHPGPGHWLYHQG